MFEERKEWIYLVARLPGACVYQGPAFAASANKRSDEVDSIGFENFLFIGSLLPLCVTVCRKI